MIPNKLKTRSAVIFAAFMLTINGMSMEKTNTFSITRDGKPSCAIVVAKNARKAARFAAAELRAHIKLITGVEIPVVSADKIKETTGKILVGESALTRKLGLDNSKFNDQEYLVKVAPESIILIGRDKDDYGKFEYDLEASRECRDWPSVWDQQGTMYAVYDFLEKCCGVKWLAPYESGTVIPTTDTLAVAPFESRRKPYFEYRRTSPGSIREFENQNLYPGTGDRNAASWKSREKLAYEKLHKRFPVPRAYQNCGKRGMFKLFAYRHKEGGRKVYCNHSLYGYYDRFWEKHSKFPDFFVGKKADFFAKGHKGDRPAQLCYTNRELIKQVVEDACDYFDGKTVPRLTKYKYGEDFFAVEPMDNDNFCKCGKCQKLINKNTDAANRKLFSNGRDSDYFFTFVNEVAKLLRKKRPDKKIVTLAYMTHAFPPGFKLEPNVAVQFCFAANRLPFATAQYQNELAALEAWSEYARKNKTDLYLWLYYTFPVETARKCKFHCFPGFFAHTIGKQFKLFKDKGYKGFFHCGYGQDVEAYLTYKLMDDPDLKVDDILNEYFTGLYGKAAAPIRQFYELVEKTYCDPANYPPGAFHQRASTAWERLGTDKRMAQLEKLMKEARKTADTDSAKRNVRIFEFSVWNYMREGKRNYDLRMAAPIPTVKVPAVESADGNPAKVDWTKSAELDERWYENASNRLSIREFEGRAAHDGKYLYLELTDHCNPSKLVASPNVAPFDDWELFIAARRALPYRQIMVGPEGAIAARLHGEINWQMDMPWNDHGVRTLTEKSGEKWVAKIAVPLAGLTSSGVKPGDKFYMNIVRVMSPARNGASKLAIDSWVSGCSVHDIDRLAEIILE
jgi:hypothetical protein